MVRPPTPAAPRRQAWFWGLAIAVGLAHLGLADRLLQARLGWGGGERMPPRIDVAFVRELAPAAPPAPPPVVAPPPAAAPRLPAVAKTPRRAASAPPPAEAASAPDAAASGPEPAAVAGTAPAASDAPPPATTVAAAASAAEPVPAAPPVPPAASAPPAQAFDWPPSTRLSYQLTGHYRGPVEGSASVEWLRQGTRYQVHLETAIGPMLSRHISSEGELTAQGLSPQRFDGEQKVMFRAARRWSLRFGPDKVTLADGREVDTVPGAQDEASQFVHLTWLFTTRPDRLRVGRSVELPLAINRKLQRWTYDIVGEEVLRFPFGEAATFHVKPRREAGGGDLTAEIWIAPTLQYLPVRILIRDGKDNWVDLMLEKPPLQAAPTAAPGPAEGGARPPPS